MPVTLVVRGVLARNGGDPEPAGALALTFDGARVVIGRGPGCDVRLPDPSVSQRHATVRVEKGKHTLLDEGSTNGTFVGGVRLAPQTPRALRSGDLIRVGRVWLEVRIDQTPATRDLAMATRELALLLVSQAMEGLGDDVVPKVRVVEGSDAGLVTPIEEEGRAYTVGRGDSCDLTLADADASREHVQIVRRGQVILVRDLGSKNGALLGELRLPRERDVPWKSTSVLRVGRTVLALQEPVALALGALESAADEPMGEEDVPPEPAPSSAGAAEKAPNTAPPRADSEAPSSRAPASVAAPNPAPVAEVATGARDAPPVKRSRSGWSATDMAVVFAALAVIALSIAGLVWLFRG